MGFIISHGACARMGFIISHGACARMEEGNVINNLNYLFPDIK